MDAAAWRRAGHCNRAFVYGEVSALSHSLVKLILECIISRTVGIAHVDTLGCAVYIRFGGQYLRSYILDCVFAGIHFSFSGYFCACGKSVLSFLHNISSVLLVRVPGSYLASMLFPDTLFPMGLASAGGSLLSVMLCILFYLKFCRGKNPAAESA